MCLLVFFSFLYILNCTQEELLLPSATKLGQGYVFTGVCDSVHRGGCLPQCMLGYHHHTPPPGADTPHPPGADTPWEQTPPRSRHRPRAAEQTPPDTEPAGRYGQRTGGTHPTGMQSCLLSKTGNDRFCVYNVCVCVCVCVCMCVCAVLGHTNATKGVVLSEIFYTTTAIVILTLS